MDFLALLLTFCDPTGIKGIQIKEVISSKSVIRESILSFGVNNLDTWCNPFYIASPYPVQDAWGLEAKEICVAACDIGNTQ